MFDNQSIEQSVKPVRQIALSAPAMRRGWRARGAIAMTALALAAGVVGGAGGTIVANRWIAGDPAPAQVFSAQTISNQPAVAADVAAPAQVLPAQTISNQVAPTADVAASVYREVGPSVVEIDVTSAGFRNRTVSGNGSGVVVDGAGYILTNYHVIEGARSITVLFSTGETRTARVIASDIPNDLAVIQVSLPAGVPVAAMADSDEVQVGQTAIAIGSPFGLAQTVTQGIISAVDRRWQPTSQDSFSGLIQTDAAINPGNSGGPLLNAYGEVIGINSMIQSPVEGSVGVGFAVPINTGRALIPSTGPQI